MWKHKTKWLVRGGRKVRCYLCGKKILAKGDLFLFHGDTGYYSHQSCQAESTTISGNERRRAVKKIAVGAAVVGAIAAGAGKFLDVSSKSNNFPAAQTILTSQGLILPALTSDPANPVPGQMWYRSDAGVEAHFDGVQNRVVYSSEINDGNVNVTSKGIVNGLSVLPNDGKGGFGPDTTKGATAPGQYGSPYTETYGIQEVSMLMLNKTISDYESGFDAGAGYVIRLNPGFYHLQNDINVTMPSSYPNFSPVLTYEGDGTVATQMWYETSNMNGFNFSVNANMGLAFINIEFFQIASTINSFIAIDDPTNVYFENVWLTGNTTSGAIVNGGVYLYGTSGSDQFLYIVGSVFVGYNIINSTNGIFAVSSQLNWSNSGVSAMTVGELHATACSVGGTIYGNVNDEENIISLTGCNIVPAEPSSSSPYVFIQCSDATTYIWLEHNNISVNADLIMVKGDSLGGPVNLIVFDSNKYSGTGNITYWNSDNASTLYAAKLSYENYSKLTGTVTPPVVNVAPSIPTNPPVSGTVYQNTNPYDIRLKIPVTYSPTSTAAATLATGISSTSTVTTSTKVSIPAGVTTGQILTYDIVVPQNWYFELVVTNATIGTVEVQAA